MGSAKEFVRLKLSLPQLELFGFDVKWKTLFRTEEGLLRYFWGFHLFIPERKENKNRILKFKIQFFFRVKTKIGLVWPRLRS